ncbi:hypothetical protein D3C71_1674750 [compost metagenome]
MHHDMEACGVEPGGQRLVENLRADKRFDAFGLERARHKGANTCSNENSAGQQLCARICLHQHAPIGLGREGRDQRAQMPVRRKRGDLPEQQRRQLAPSAHGHARNVVDGLVAIQLDALAACMGQRVDQMGLEALQAQLEHLEQTHGACTDHDGICFFHHD